MARYLLLRDAIVLRVEYDNDTRDIVNRARGSRGQTSLSKPLLALSYFFIEPSGDSWQTRSVRRWIARENSVKRKKEPIMILNAKLGSSYRRVTVRLRAKESWWRRTKKDRDSCKFIRLSSTTDFHDTRMRPPNPLWRLFISSAQAHRPICARENLSARAAHASKTPNVSLVTRRYYITTDILIFPRLTVVHDST